MGGDQYRYGPHRRLGRRGGERASRPVQRVAGGRPAGGHRVRARQPVAVGVANLVPGVANLVLGAHRDAGAATDGLADRDGVAHGHAIRHVNNGKSDADGRSDADGKSVTNRLADVGAHPDPDGNAVTYHVTYHVAYGNAVAEPLAVAEPPPSPPFTLGWYPADSSTFDAPVIDALAVKPQVVNYYSGWNEPFNTSFAQAAYADGIQTFVEMEPWNCGTCTGDSVPEMTDIASGVYDGYLTSFGQAIKAFGHPVLVTFAHEMNGGWYPWGYGGSEGTTPAQWIAAWDHVVTLVNAQAPGLVTWVWAPNVEIGATSIAQYWPGPQYVGEVGLDGYLSSDSATYQSEFGQTVADVRAITDLPIWITETGVNQDDSAGDRLAALATAVEQAGLTGMLYFDQGPAVLTPEEEQILADIIGPWLTFPPTPTPTPTPVWARSGPVGPWARRDS